MRRSSTTLGLLSAFLILIPAMAKDYGDSPVAEALTKADARVQAIIDVPDSQRNFRNTLEAVDDLLAHLELDTNMTLFMAYVSTDAAERERGQRGEEDVTNWRIDLGQNEELYKAVKAYTDTQPNLQGIEQRMLRHTLRDYRRAGMDLPKDQREKLKELRKQINTLSIEFEKNIREDETRVPLLREELTGLPDSYFDNPSLVKTGDVYLIGMSYPQFIPIMDYCDNEKTREKVWVAYKRRGGEKNIGVLEQILKLRAEAAEMIGYPTTADYETEVRMSKNAQTVQDFYARLRPMVRKKALLDYEELLEAKREHTGDPDATIKPWDTSYYTNELKKSKYAVDSEQVREYFPLDRVMDGLFSITQSLYGLEYKEITDRAASEGRPMWHEDVRLYEVWDKASNEMIGEFYIDLHPRPNKFSHAAQWGLKQHKVWADGTVTKPLAALVCNFTEPTADAPSLMTHDEVETFFHEFGHCLHTILSKVRLWSYSGTGVERDFVEAPSQMFENWIWDADVLNTFAGHYKTGEPLPREMVEGMIETRNLGSGMLAERQFYYGLFDFTAHMYTTEQLSKMEPGFTTKLANQLWDPNDENVELYDPVDATYFQAAFGHLTGYQAGYYGYQWSLVYASDMFQRFKELGMLDPEAGMYYREKILSRGGTLDGLDLVRDYLGREPDMTAYLKHLGLEVE